MFNAKLYIRIFSIIATFLFAISVCAGQHEVEEASRRRYEHGDLDKLISVVKTAEPPTIDGIMEPEEWGKATSITGLTEVSYIFQSGTHGCGCDDPDSPRGSRGPQFIMIENMASHQSAFWITYDDENLYIAHHSPPPPNIKDMPAIIEVMLKKEQTLHDSNIDKDDCINIEIMSPVYPGGDNYIIQVNSLGTTFECIWGGQSGNMPGITLGWDPEIKRASTLTLDGWFIELAVPWSEFEPHFTKPQPGEKMYMNFGRIWREIMDEPHAWQGYDGYRPKGGVVFMGEEGIIVKLNDTGNLPRGDAAFSAGIKNLYNSQRNLVAEVKTDSGELYESVRISLNPGETSRYSFEGKITDFETTVIAFSVSDADTGEVFHLTTLPVIRPTKPEFFIRRYRSRELSRIETDISFIGSADLNRTSIVLTLTDKETGRRALRKRYRGFASYQPVLEFSTEGLAPGDYEASFVFSAPGMRRYEASIDYKHPELPEWWNNRYGYEDMDNDIVPFPWTDMELEDGTLKVWGRNYQFGSGFLPEQITILDLPLLRSPMKLIVHTKDGNVIDTSTSEVASIWTKTNRTRVEGTRQAGGSSVKLKNSFWAEYDGLIWTKITAAPVGAGEIVSMVLEIPLTKEFTDVINPMDYSLRTTGKLKDRGYSGPPTRPIWLGNAEGGIQFINNTDNSFFVEDHMKIIEVENKEEGATLRVTMIDIPTSFQAPYSVEFGIIATPVRPKLTRTPYFNNTVLRGGGAWYPADMAFVPAADPGYDPYGYGRQTGRIYVHTSPVNVSPESMRHDMAGSEDYLFADEFRANPTERTLSRVKTDLKSPASRDYFVWRHWRYQQKYGFQGLYYDSPSGFSLGLRDVMKRLYNITLSNRNFAAREANIGLHSSAMFDMASAGFAMYNWDAENYNSVINANQQTYKGFTDPAMFRAQHLGHNFGWPLFFLGQGRIRRDWVEANGGPEAVFDQISGLDLLHDGIGVCCIMPAIEGSRSQEMRRVRERMNKALTKYNFKHWKYQMVPYWKQDIVELPQEGMYASFYIARPSVLTSTNPREHQHRHRVFSNYFDTYKHLAGHIQSVMIQEIEDERRYLETLKDRAIIIFYNDTDWEGELRLSPDWNKLGLGSPDGLNAENAVHSTGFRLEKDVDGEGNAFEKAVFFERPDEYASIEDGELLFPMTGHNYRMIVIEKN